MKNRLSTIILASVLALSFKVGFAQVNTYHSVLSEHTWYRLSVTKEGVYKLDYATLQAMGIDMNVLNPNQIRIYGNPSGALPEKNSKARPDDLTEMAILVDGAEDATFDQGDVVYFYGQEPTVWKMINSSGNTYARERNYYTDTTYYYLCVDSGQDGLPLEINSERFGEPPCEGKKDGGAAEDDKVFLLDGKLCQLDGKDEAPNDDGGDNEMQPFLLAQRAVFSQLIKFHNGRFLLSKYTH